VADDIDQLLSARADADDGDIDALLAARVGMPAVSASKSDPLSPARLKEFEAYTNRDRSLPWYERAATGFNDPMLGAGQILQNIPGVGATLEKGRELVGMAGNVAGELASGVPHTPYAHEATSTEDFNAMVRRREQYYQHEREGAGQEGLDWWRIGGTVANPVTWLAPESLAARGLFTAIGAGAKAGMFQALLQPVTSDGNFLLDKGVQAAIGGAAGGTLGGALHALQPVWGHAKTVFGKLFGSADEATQAAAAAKVTDDTLKAAGADPSKVDPNLYSAIKREVGDALKAGVEPDARVMTNRADASALPVPINLTRGQATRDPMQFAWEQRVAGQQGAGEQLTALLKEQNRALIENLNVLGAKNAPSTFDASQKLIQHIDEVNNALRERISAAYGAVRDSAGRPALMSTEEFTKQSKNLLTEGRPELASLVSLADYLPETVAKQYNDILSGKLPLTVDTAQFLDRAWGGVQRGTQDSTIKTAIGHLRTALNQAPVSDALGAESMAAYQTAKQLAKQRFDLIRDIPAFKAVDNGVEPDKFFQRYVQGANVSELAGLKQLVGQENTTMLQQTMLGNLKKAALNKASDENGVFSQSTFNNILQDPVQAPRIAELFKGDPQTLGHLYRIGRVSENLIKIPAGSKVNTSNTASAVSNIVRDVAKSEAGSALWNLVPGGTAMRHIATEAKKKVAESQAINEALNPGVTQTALKPAAPSGQVKRLSDLLAKAGAVGGAYATRDDEE
jgi:hypothetical protein